MTRFSRFRPKVSILAIGLAFVLPDALALAGLRSGTGSISAVSNCTITNDDISGCNVLVEGGDNTGDIGAFAPDGNAIGNTITIREVNSSGGSHIHGGHAKYEAIGNRVNMEGGVFTGSGNKISGGYSLEGDAKGNSVILDDVRLEGAVYGGWSQDAEASYNTIVIDGYTVIDGQITVGHVDSGSSGEATGNTLIIQGFGDLRNADIRLGDSASSGPDVFSGNRLVADVSSGTLQVKSVANVEEYTFLLPADIRGNDAVMKANSFTFGNGQGRNSKVRVQMPGSGAFPDSIRLFELTGGGALATSGLDGSGDILGQKGLALLFDMELMNDGRGRVKNARAHPQLKALSEGYLSGVALLARSADLAAGKGLDAAREGQAGFAVISESSSRYETGSRIDVDGVSLMAGLSGKFQIDPGMLTVGVFINHGSGNYDTHNSLANATIKGNGDTRQVGAGLLARLDFAATDTGYSYAETSLQLGRVESDFKSGDLRYINGYFTQPVTKYHTRSGYQSVHFGGGHVWKVSESEQLDLYGKYLYARRGGDSVTLESDDTIRFKAIASHRLRIGGRYAWTHDNVTPYAGLAWEHEFDGKARATTYGHSIDAPSMKGGAGIVEFGLSFAPGETLPVSIDFGIQGYGGKRRGAGGAVKVKYDF
jgi:hypothetical protein